MIYIYLTYIYQVNSSYVIGSRVYDTRIKAFLWTDLRPVVRGIKKAHRPKKRFENCCHRISQTLIKVPKEVRG